MAGTLISSTAAWSADPTSRCGPFKDGSGNLWVVLLSQASGPFLKVFKSTDSGATWGTSFTSATLLVGPAGGSQGTLDCVFDSANGVIYALVQLATPSRQLSIWKFTIATTTWAQVDAGTGAPVVVGDGVSTASFRNYLVRRSTGEFVVLYQGPTHSNMGTAYATVYYARCSAAGVWSAGVECDGTTAQSAYLKCACLGPSDRVQFGYHLSFYVSNSLDSSNVLGTAGGSIAMNAASDMAIEFFDPTLGLGWRGPGGSNDSLYRYTPGPSPTYTTDAGSVLGSNNVDEATCTVAVVYEPTRDRLYAFARLASNSNVYFNTCATPASNTTWGSFQPFEFVLMAGISIGLGVAPGSLALVWNQTSATAGIYYETYAPTGPKPFTAAFAGTSTLSTTLNRRPANIPIAFAGTSSLAAPVGAMHRFTAALAGTSSLAATAKAIKPITGAVFAGTSSLAAPVSIWARISLALAGTSALTAPVTIWARIAPVALAGTSSLAAPVTRRRPIPAFTLAGTSALTAKLISFPPTLPFPSTSLLDDFNQPANTSPPSSNWSLIKIGSSGGNLAVSPKNFVRNPSFEVDASEWIVSGAGGAIARVTDDKLFGAASLQVTTAVAGGANTGCQSNPAFGTGGCYPVTPGAPASFSFYAKARPGYGGTLLNAQVNQLDNTKALVVYSPGSDVALSETAWTRISWSGTLDANCVWVQLYANISDTYPSLSSVWLIDGVQFETAPAPTAYDETAGGGTVKGDEIGYWWAGGYWNVAQYLDSEIWVGMSEADRPGDNNLNLYLRGSAADLGTWVNHAGYGLRWYPDGSLSFERNDQGIGDSVNNWLYGPQYVFADGDALGMRVRGTNPVILEAWLKQGAGPWTMVARMGDNDPALRVTTPGYVGFVLYPLQRVGYAGGGLVIRAPISGTFAGTSSLTATLSLWAQIAVPLAGTSSVAATLTEYHKISALPIAGTSALSATVVEAHRFTLALAGTSALTSPVIPYQRIALPLAGTSALAAAVTKPVKQITLVVAGTSSLAASVTEYHRIPAFPIAGTSALTAAITEYHALGAVPLAGSSSLTATATEYRRFSLALAGTSALTSAVTPYQRIAPTLAGTSALAASVTEYHKIAALALAGTSSLAAGLGAYQRIIVPLAGTSTLAASVSIWALISPTLAGTSALAATVTAYHKIPAFFIVGTSTLSATVAPYQRFPLVLAGTSTFVTVLVSGYVAWTPASLPGLAMWFDASQLGLADGAAVASWPDRSGNGFAATQATGTLQPLCKTNQLTGKSVARFDGVDDYLLTPASYSWPQEHTVVVLYRCNLSVIPTGQGIANAGTNPNRIFQLRQLNVTTAESAGFNTVAGSSVDDMPGATQMWLRLAYVRTLTGVESVVEGATDGPTAVTGTAMSGSYPLYLGAANFNLKPGAIDIAEMVVYDHALTPTDRQRVEAYLAAKWFPVTVAGTSSLSATLSSYNLIGGAVLAGTSSLATTAVPYKRITPTFAGTSALASPVIDYLPIPPVAFAGSSSLVAHVVTAVVYRNFAAAFAGSSSLSAAFTETKQITLALAGKSTLAASLVLWQRFPLVLAGGSSLAATLIEYHRVGAVSLAGTSSLSASLTTYFRIAPVIAGSSSLAASLVEYHRFAAVLAGSSGLAATLVALRPISVALAGGSSLSASITEFQRIALALAGASGVTATFVEFHRIAPVVLAGASSLTGAIGHPPVPITLALAGTSTFTAVVVSGYVPFTPPVLPGLAVWFDASQIALADGADVSPWPNLGNAATPGAMVGSPAPTLHKAVLNGLPVVRFTTSEGRLRIASGTGVSGDWTLAYVARMRGPNNGRVVGGIYPPNNMLIGWWTSFQDVMYDAGFTAPDVRVPWTTDWKLYGGDGVAGVNSRFIINGAVQGSTTAPGGWGGTLAISGYDSGLSQETCDCDVAEVVMYDHKLSDADRQRLESYLRGKWLPVPIIPTFAGTSSVAATFQEYLRIALPLAGTSALVTTAVPYKRITVPLAGTSSLAATVLLTKPVALALSGASSLAASLTEYHRIVSTVAGTSTLGASLTEYHWITAAVAGGSSLAASLTGYQRITTAVSGTSTLTAAFTEYHRITLPIAGASSLSANLTPYQRITVPLVGVSTLNASIRQATAHITVTLTGASALTAVVVAYKRFAVPLAGTSTLAAALALYDRVVLSLAGSSSLAALLTPYMKMSVSLSGRATLVATVIALRRFGLNLAGASALAAVLTPYERMVVVLAGQSSLAAPLTPYERFALGLAGSSSLNATFVELLKIRATLAGDSALAAAIGPYVLIALTLAGQGTLTPEQVIEFVAIFVRLAGRGTLTTRLIVGAPAVVVGVLTAVMRSLAAYATIQHNVGDATIPSSGGVASDAQAATGADASLRPYSSEVTA